MRTGWGWGSTYDGPKPLSPSQISSILTCGEKFRLERVVKAPQREGWASIAGSAIHKATEDLDLQRFNDTGM